MYNIQIVNICSIYSQNIFFRQCFNWKRTAGTSTTTITSWRTRRSSSTSSSRCSPSGSFLRYNILGSLFNWQKRPYSCNFICLHNEHFQNSRQTRSGSGPTHFFVYLYPTWKINVFFSLNYYLKLLKKSRYIDSIYAFFCTFSFFIFI